MFEWDEDAQSDLEHQSVYNHTEAKISDEEDGLLVDTGARRNLTGRNLVDRQSCTAQRHGYKTTWTTLDQPRRMSGVGKGAQIAHRAATIHGVVGEGDQISYSAPVLEEEGAEVPALYGLDPMAARNTYVGTRTGRLHMIPEGKDDEIIWPKGTRVIECKKARPGHWMIPISRWHKLKRKKDKVTEAFAVSADKGLLPDS